jgi:Domain of unknown function (DUF2828)
MTTFANALNAQNNRGLTANGAGTNLTTNSACLDFFANAPAMRGKTEQARHLFTQAFNENAELALRTLLWLRDVRGGAGERQLFRDLLWLYMRNTEDTPTILRLLRMIPEVGRWDDLVWLALRANEHGLHGRVIQITLQIYDALCNNDRLAAKWMPRKGPGAELLAPMWSNIGNYRRVLAAVSDTVEQKMCAHKWNDINFGAVPSIAAKNYQKAFNKRAPTAYQAYRDGLKSGTTKINAAAIFPHDVITGVYRGVEDVAEAQWKALPDYFNGQDASILPLIDVSGSMVCSLGRTGSVTCRDTAIGLGIYAAERQRGAFRNLVYTFSSDVRPVFLSDSMTLRRKVDLVNDGWAGSTNLEAAFAHILKTALAGNVPQEEMPKTLLVLSDMEFDQGIFSESHIGWGTARNAAPKTSLEMLRQQYAAAGYEMPKVVYWNLNARLGNNPVTTRDDGTMLVGGFSPSLFKTILSGKVNNPEQAMLDTVMIDRYDYNRAA